MANRSIETEWFDIPGYVGVYQVTRGGQVRSLPRYVNSPAAGGRRLVMGRAIKVVSVKGYPAIQVRDGQTRKTIYLHRVMATLFIPNLDGKPDVNHINGNKSDFSVVNLEWCTHKENMRHAYETGLATPRDIGPGERSPSSKLTDAIVRDIKTRLASGWTQKALADLYGVSSGTIGFIARGETWGHVQP